MAIGQRNTQNTRQEQAQVVSYLNIYIPDATGARRRVGAIPLMSDNRVHVAIAKRLAEVSEEEFEETLEAFIGKLEFEYRINNQEEPSFDW